MADNTSVATVQEMLDRLEARCNENPGCLKRILKLLVKKDDGFVIQPQNPRYEDERVGFTVDATIAEIAESKREPLLTVVDKDKAVVDRDKVFDELSNEESNCFDNPTKALLGDDQTKSLLKFFQDKTLNSATCEDFIKGLPISSSVQGVMLKSLMVATEVGSDDIKVFDGMLVKNREVQDDEVVVVNVDDSTQRRVLETEILEATDFGAGVTDPNRSKVLISEWGQSVGRGISLVNSNRRCDDQNKGMIHNDNLLIMEYRNEVVEVSDPFRFRLLLMGMNMIPYSRSMGSNDATLNLGINSMKSSLNWHCNIITVRHEIDLVAYVFLKGLCLQGDLDFAMEFFNKMIYNSLIPTSCSFNWLIHRFYHMEEDLKHDSTATNEAVQVDADYKSAFYTLDVAERKRIQLEIHFCILRYTMQLTIVSFEANDSTSSGRIEAHYLLARLGKLFHLLEVDYIGDLMNELVTSKGCCCGIFTFKVMMSNPNVWNVDLQDYFVQPYNLVLHYMPEKDQATIQLLSQWFNLNSENVIWGNYSITNFQFLNFDPWGQGSFEGRRNVIVGREANNGDMLTKMLSRMLDCMEELVYDVTVQDKISNEINSYKNVVGEVGRKIAVKDRDTLLPAEWWSTYGTGMLLFLMDVLSLFSSTNRDQYVNLNFLNTRMVTSFEKCPTPSCVVINPKGNKMMIVETNCCIQDALCMAKNLIRNNSIVYGGGSVEISCSIAIEAAADKYPEVEQYVIRAIADALDSFPMALAKNSGLQSIETLSALKSQQIKENNPHYGIEWCWD